MQNAFWLKEADEGWWFLYVASEQITDDNFDVAYRKVGRISDALQDPWFDLMQVKVIGEDNPLAKAAAEALHAYPGRTPLRLRNDSFGGVFADEVYIYPSPIPAPAR